MSAALLLWAWLAAAWAAPVELNVWHAYRGQERAALEAVLAEFDAAHPDVTVRPLALPAESFITKLEAAAPRGNGPDLFIAAHERVGDWSATGLLAPVEGLDTAPYHPITVEALRYDGDLYGVPLAYKCLALFYNRALVRDPAGTTDALLAQLRDLTGGGRYGLAYQADAPYFFAPWMHGHGGGVYQGDAVALDQPGNVAGLAFLRKITVEEGLIPEEPTGALVTQLFNEGQAAYVISGPWFLGEIDPKVDFAVAPLPRVSATGLSAAPFLTVEGAFVSAYAAQPEAARALARFLADTPAALNRAVEGRQSVATLAAYADPRVANDPVLAAFRAQLDHSVPMPNRPEMAATWEPLARALRRVIRGDLLPQAALETAQTEFAIITRPPPPPASPTPWLALLGAVVLGGLGWFIRTLAQPGKLAEIRAWSYAYLYVGPAAVSMGVLVMLPFVVGAGVSFFAHHQGSFTFVGLANYLDIVLARDWPVTSALSFYFTLLVTVLWTVANVALHVTIGVALAMLLREPWVRLRGFWRVALIIPWAVPNYITALIWKGMFHRQFGAINGLLGALGLEPVSWFGSFTTAFAANLTTNTWLGFPFMMVVTLGALQAIPRDLEQAADVDGADRWQRFRHITLPLLKPALLPAVVLGSVWTFNMFNIIYLVSGGEPDGSTEILISEAYRWAFTRQARYGYASAYAVLIFLVLLGYSRLGNRIAGRKVL
ncbi:MAG: extracellular solute-binding protein [Alphaproteobacteria bacterium]|nr:extracellular solute-binding protein [Alphaproteobacteria bacterium]